MEFLDVLQREVWKKRIFAFLAFLFFLAFTFILVYLKTFVKEKSIVDYYYEYLVCRLNYYPERKDLQRAYFKCPKQARFLGYDDLARQEISEILRKKLVSFFRPSYCSFVAFEGGKFYMLGRRTVGIYEGEVIRVLESGDFVACGRIFNRGILLEKVLPLEGDPKEICNFSGKVVISNVCP